MTAFRPNSSTVFSCAALLASLLGCDASGGRVNAPRIDPPAMAQAALTQYDSNRDQLLDAAELDRCPSLKRNLSLLDVNRDAQLTADEIAARLRSFVDAKIGLVGFSARFTLDGQPLESARVVLTPEKFLDSAVQSAVTTTTHDGVGFFQISEDLPGVQPGFYRLEIYRPGPDGNELIPPRYNTATTLGIDAGVDGPDVNNRIHFALTTKINHEVRAGR